MLQSLSNLVSLRQPRGANFDRRWSVVLVLAGASVGLYRLVFAHRLRVPGGGRGRAPRLGVVDVFALDGQRQLVIVRRDNVEHLLMIGGPNDLVVEPQILRTAVNGANGREVGQADAPGGTARRAAAAPAVAASRRAAPARRRAARRCAPRRARSRRRRAVASSRRARRAAETATRARRLGAGARASPSAVDAAEPLAALESLRDAGDQASGRQSMPRKPQAGRPSRRPPAPAPSSEPAVADHAAAPAPAPIPRRRSSRRSPPTRRSRRRRRTSSSSRRRRRASAAPAPPSPAAGPVGQAARAGRRTRSTIWNRWRRRWPACSAATADERAGASQSSR